MEPIHDFKSRFDKVWKKFFVDIRPSQVFAFLYYLKALDPEISVMIQSLGGETLPQSYDLAIKAESSLILSSKLPPLLLK